MSYPSPQKSSGIYPSQMSVFKRCRSRSSKVMPEAPTDQNLAVDTVPDTVIDDGCMGYSQPSSR